MDRRSFGRTFGRVLRAYRRSRGLTQEELAERADLDRTYPSLLERGLRSPSLLMVFQIAEALGIDPAELVSKTAHSRKLSISANADVVDPPSPFLRALPNGGIHVDSGRNKGG